MKSVNQSRSGAGAEKSRCIESSVTAGPGVLPATRRPFFVVVDQVRCSRDSVHPVLAHLVTAVLQLVVEEPVVKGGVVGVQVEQGVGQVRVVPVTLADRALMPLVERLTARAQLRRSARRGSPRRPVLGPAGTSPWEGAFREIGGGAAQYLDLQHETPVVASQLNDLILLSARGAALRAVIDVGLAQPTRGRRQRDVEVVGDLVVGELATASHPGLCDTIEEAQRNRCVDRLKPPLAWEHPSSTGTPCTRDVIESGADFVVDCCRVIDLPRSTA